MKPFTALAGLLIFTILVLVFSCTRELSCEGCSEANQPPIANAGADTTIFLPLDSVLLDGSASSDPDGSIKEWQWTKLSGPASFSFSNASAEKTTVKNLAEGVYQFELNVTDDEGASAKDTVQVTVGSQPVTNQSPLACAGSDLYMTLPTNAATLDGSCTRDPDNNIATYQWTKVAGPPSSKLTNADSVIAYVAELTEGDYIFELNVTDSAGLISKDTVVIAVREGHCDNNQPPVISNIPCGNNRPQVNAQLLPIGQLSQPRTWMSAAAAGNKLLFAGGVFKDQTSTYQYSSRVDIFDLSTQHWSTAELSLARNMMAATVNGNKLFFAGGEVGDGTAAVDAVDVYDVAANTWTVHKLSVPGNSIAAAAVGDKVLFAGGDGGISRRWRRSHGHLQGRFNPVR